MDALVVFQLFSFVPVLAFGGVFWYERLKRQGDQARTSLLLWSLVTLAAAGVVQSAAWVFREAVPFSWPQVYVLSSLLYFLALFLLEYAVHVKRIEESFLVSDFRREVVGLGLWVGAAVFFAVVVLAGSASWQWSHRTFPLNVFLDGFSVGNGYLAYGHQMRLLILFFSLALVGAALWTARRVFNLQEGVIRRRGYPFYSQIFVTAALLVSVLWAPVPSQLHEAWFLPLGWFLFLHLAYLWRFLEEFFFWSQYNLRIDRVRMEQRQHTQNLLIRRVIGASEDDDRSILREVMEGALEKARGRMVVQEYRMTGMVVYRAAGSVLKVEDGAHIIGYCTPLTDSKTVKNLDKQNLTDQILRTTFDWTEIRDTPVDQLKEFGKRLIHAAVVGRRIVVTDDLPDGLKGLQRLAVAVPVYDSDVFLGMLFAYKDSFDRLYPGEFDVLGELAENLATVYSLIAGKEIQRERNRLQGEMALARNIQTSILPRRPTLPGYQVATLMETATEVGGDVFDFLPTPWGTLFGIGDVAGHGLPAGMMAVISVAALHGAVDASKSLGKALTLDQIYDAVNRVLCTLNRDRIGSDKFMTQNYFLASGDSIGHVGTHLVAALWRAGSRTIEELTALTNRTGFLGLSEHLPSVQSVDSFRMESGDVLVLYSDGVSEAKNGQGTLYGLEGIKRVLADRADGPPEDLVAHLMDDLRHHATLGDLKKHGGRFADDVSLVVLKKD